MVGALEAAVALLLGAAALWQALAGSIGRRHAGLLRAGAVAAGLIALVPAATAVPLVARYGPARWTFSWAPWPGMAVTAGIEVTLLGTLLALGAAAATALAVTSIAAWWPAAPPSAVIAALLGGAGAVLLANAPDVVQLTWLAGLLSLGGAWLCVYGSPEQRRPPARTAVAHPSLLLILLLTAEVVLLLAAVRLAQVSGSPAIGAVLPAAAPGAGAACLIAAAVLALALPIQLLADSARPLAARAVVLIPACAGGWVLLWRVDSLVGGPERPAPLLVLLGLGLSAWAAFRLVAARLHSDESGGTQGLWRAIAGDLLGVALVGLGAGGRGWPGAALTLFAAALLFVEHELASRRPTLEQAVPVAYLPAALVGRCLAYWTVADDLWLAVAVLMLGVPAFGVPAAMIGLMGRTGCAWVPSDITQLVGAPRTWLLAASVAGAILVRPLGVLLVGSTAMQDLVPASGPDPTVYLIGLRTVELLSATVLGLVAVATALGLLRAASTLGRLRRSAPGREALQTRPGPRWPDFSEALDRAVSGWHGLLQVLHGRYYIIGAVLVGVATVVLLAQ
jgi:hypothetical protein